MLNEWKHDKHVHMTTSVIAFFGYCKEKYIYIRTVVD